MGDAFAALRAQLRAELSADIAQVRGELAELRRSLERGRAGPAEPLGVKVAPLGAEGGSDEDSGSSGDSDAELVAEGSVALTDLEVEHTYEFHESCWDVGLFLCYGPLGLQQNLALAFVCALNVVIQIGITAFVQVNFAKAKYDDQYVAGLLQWRVTDGHSLRTASLIGSTSLASRVCGGDPTAITSSTQMQAVEELEGWLQDGNAWLCVVAIFLWAVLILSEVHQAVRFLAAIVALPQSAASHLEAGGEEEKTLCIRGLSCGRRLLGQGIATLRIAIALGLLLAGARWLAFTGTAEGLILNAVALAFVIDCDEYLYPDLCPPKAKLLLSSLQPLRIPGHVRSWTSSLSWILVPCFVALMYWSTIVPNVEMMSSAYTMLCGGEQNFVVTRDALGRVRFAFTKEVDEWPLRSPYNESWSPNDILHGVAEQGTLNQAFAVVVGKIIQGSGRVMGRVHVNGDLEAQRADNFHDLTQVDKLKAADLAAERHCTDALGWGGGQGGYVATGNSSLRGCEHATQYCHQSLLMRFYCPETCGCASRTVGLLLPFERTGCPTACEKTRKAVFDLLNCTDWSSERLMSSRGWTALISTIGRWRDMDGILDRLLGDGLAALEREGCPALGNFSLAPKIKLCRSDLASFCPASCGCNGRFHAILKDHCPTACASG